MLKHCKFVSILCFIYFNKIKINKRNFLEGISQFWITKILQLHAVNITVKIYLNYVYVNAWIWKFYFLKFILLKDFWLYDYLYYVPTYTISVQFERHISFDVLNKKIYNNSNDSQILSYFKTNYVRKLKENNYYFQSLQFILHIYYNLLYLFICSIQLPDLTQPYQRPITIPFFFSKTNSNFEPIFHNM